MVAGKMTIDVCENDARNAWRQTPMRLLGDIISELWSVDALHDEEAHDAAVVVEVERALLAHTLEHIERTPWRLLHAQLEELRAHCPFWRAPPSKQPLENI